MENRRVTRRLEVIVSGRLGVEPVIALQGPRSVGKTTLLGAVAAACRSEVLDLDDPATRNAVRADPALFVRGPGLVCIDEHQQVPLLLDAIKAELNRDLRPGRFLLTGSTRADALPRTAQALTGRMHTIAILPFSQGELAGTPEAFLAGLLAGEPPAHPLSSTTTREDYAERASRGGFPLAVTRGSPDRERWFDDYVRSSLERDVAAMTRVRDAPLLPRLLDRLMAQTAQVLNVRSAAKAEGIAPATAESWIRLLEAVFLLQRLPAWGTTLRARAAHSPKLHAVDSGVAARLLGLTPIRLTAARPASLTQFGHLLETFVVGEVLKQASWLGSAPRLGHWRTHDGTEVDLVVERSDGGVVAFEVKAAGYVDPRSLGGLRTLRSALGEAFIAGVVLYTGPRSYPLEDRLHALPLDRLWA